MKRPCFAVAALCSGALTLGCDRASETRPDSARPAAATDASRDAASAPQPARSVTPCPRTGRWAICAVEKRLEQSGFVPRKVEGEAPPRLGFSVHPVAYSLGRARLEIFLYPDETSLSRDLAALDTVIVAPRGKKNDWEIPPRFIRSGNLMAVFLTRNEQQAERVSLALTAGAPQR